ncbi:ATP-binding protein [Aestuariispira insulae]|uniref:ATP-binding protein n=1 Tax=Aestuariispira insulae TaxID=1461337 RepID=UPI0015F24A24|nr:ATP-binding protein [Aestuariispira insulae]
MSKAMGDPDKDAEAVLGAEDRLSDAVAFGLCLVSQELKIIRWNQWLADHSSISAAEAVGRTLFDLFPELEKSRFAFSLKGTLASGMAAYLSRSLNQSPFPLFSKSPGASRDERLQQEIQIMPFRLGSGARTALVQIRDATSDFSRERELRQLNEDFRQARVRAEEANLTKSQFLAAMSHEIRTPLNGVLGMTRLLRDSELNNAQIELVETILSSGSTLMAVLNDVLDMSKIEAGELELEKVDFEPRSLIVSVVSMFRTLAETKGIKLELDYQLPDDFALKGDPARLRQIVWNLLSNAIKFTEIGEVRLACELRPKRDDGKLEIQLQISDTGIGIAEEMQEKIFDPFQQADKSTTRTYGGTGLGLALVKNILSAMEGTISVESSDGEGTCFTLLLPMEEGWFGAIDTDKSYQPSGVIPENRRILVAEDNMVNARIAEAFLKKRNQLVTVVEDGQQAVDAMSSGNFDLIFMDVHMPVMDGLEATAAIRAFDDQEKSSVPIVGLTADAFIENHRIFRQGGMDDVLTKPVNERALDRVLYHFLSRRAPVMVDEPDDKDKSQAGSEIFNRAGFSRVATAVSKDVLLDILASAITSFDREMMNLKVGISQKDGAHCREALHAIKGLASTISADRLAGFTGQLEQNGADPADLDLIYQELSGLLQETEQAIDVELNRIREAKT